MQLGHDTLRDDIDLVEKLVSGMRTNSKYVGLSNTLRMVKDLKWEDAVEHVTVFDTHANDHQDIVAKAHLAKNKFKKKGSNHRSDIQCHRCKKYGHYANKCFSTQPIGENSRKYQGQHHSHDKDNQRNDWTDANTSNKKPKLQCYVCGEDHKASLCPRRYVPGGSNATTVGSDRRQAKFGATAYMMRVKPNLEHSIENVVTDPQVIAHESTVTRHLKNGGSLRTTWDYRRSTELLRLCCVQTTANHVQLRKVSSILTPWLLIPQPQSI